MNELLTIAVDFDGTCVTHEYPSIGKNIGAAPVLKALTDKGHKLILHTMRSGKLLEEAVKWFRDNDIPLIGVNKNPSQSSWTDSNKVYADIYIDDSALGCPVTDYDKPIRECVDWVNVLNHFTTKRVFNSTENVKILQEVTLDILKGILCVGNIR